MYGFGYGRQARRSGSRVTRNIIAANRALIGADVTTLAAGQISWREHWASPEADITDIVITLAGWYYHATTHLATNIGSNAPARVIIEYPAGTWTDILFSASNTTTIPNGALILSDPNPLTIFKGTKFLLGLMNPDSVTHSYACSSLPAGADVIGVSDQFRNSLDGSSRLNTTGGVGATKLPAVAAITGTVKKANAKAFKIFSHSIGAKGVGDTLGCGPKGGSGWVQRALDAFYPYLVIGNSGMQAQHLVGDTKLQALLAVAGGTDSIIDFAHNDLTGGNRTVAQAVADTFTILGYVPTERWWVAPPMPMADSTDGWITVANQTEVLTTNESKHWYEVRDAFQTAATSNGAYKFIDSYAFLESSANSGHWAAPDQAAIDGILPSDHTHPATVGHIRAAGILIDALDLSTSSTLSTITAKLPATQSATTLRRMNALLLAMDNCCTALSSLDGFYCFWVDDEASAKVNWFGTAANLTKSGTVTFAAKTGYTGDATGYLDTGYNLRSGGGNYALNTAFMSLYAQGKTGNLSRAMGAYDGVTEADLAGYMLYLSARINDATSVTVGSAPVAYFGGFLAARRTASNARTLSRNGQQLFADTIASVAIPNATMKFGTSGNGVGSTTTLGCAVFGSSLPAVDGRCLTQALGAMRALQAHS